MKAEEILFPATAKMVHKPMIWSRWRSLAFSKLPFEKSFPTLLLPCLCVGVAKTQPGSLRQPGYNAAARERSNPVLAMVPNVHTCRTAEVVP